MKKKYFLIVLSIMFVACGGSSPKVSKIKQTGETANDRQRETVAAHTVKKEKEKETGYLPNEQFVKKSEKKTKWTRSGDPIDTSIFDDKIAATEKALKANPGNAIKKAALADAYFKRGMALTRARQYASAIGDYRRALKYDPRHAESKEWIAKIVGIYNSMNREIPKEGEEPAALEFKKKTG